MFMTPWVQRLLIANVLVFFLTYQNEQLLGLLALRPFLIVRMPWTLVTYMFLHANLTHLFFNMFMLFVFGPRLEERLGGASFLRFYLLCGLGGAVLSILTFAISPFGAMVGASGAVFGVTLGFARYWPRDEIYIWGVLPIQARMLAFLMVASSLYFGVTGARDGVAHFAHLGGVVAAWIYLKVIDRRKRVRFVERPNSHYKAPGVHDLDAKDRWEAIPRDRLHEVNREEVELLLEKVRTLGVRALTHDERAFLDRMANSV